MCEKHNGEHFQREPTADLPFLLLAKRGGGSKVFSPLVGSSDSTFVVMFCGGVPLNWAGGGEGL